ncbi:Ger(x)C family spore germination protein [Mesobacillus maritimus]|uniref:Ger(X)C family spore germination protein n=1 Tax=Mesobacillus maritimus TaxID=1643336 RepID=A0ABS7K141_9BACI|nr:Ger(x)C family spore germination protein [Mesobacillus maritimus]MBY0095976.1 Ger(x)C family spore germination protein [Mesobacillus maritimus]
MKRNYLILTLHLILCVLLSGCWSKKELTDLAIISAMGLDLNDKGEYVSTLQVINPSNVAGGLQGGGGSKGPPVTVYTATGSNIIEVNQVASTKLPRRRYYAHTNLLVIGEELARKEGIDNILDAFERNPEFRMTAVIIIAQGAKASDLLKVMTPVDKIPANKIIKNLKFTEEQWGEFFTINLQNAIKDLTTTGKSTVITGFSVSGSPEQGKKLENIQDSDPETTIGATGLGIFKEGKLINWFEGKTARGTGWILHKVKNTGISFSWMDKEDAVVYQIIREQTNSIPKIKKGKPHITIEVKAEGNIMELRMPADLMDPLVLLKMEKEIEKTIKDELLLAVEEAKKNKTDIFGFGEAFHQSYPKDWEKLKEGWHDVHFPELAVDVKVDAYIRRTGLRNNANELQ